MLYTMNVEKIKRLLLMTIGVMTAIIVYYIWEFHREKPQVEPRKIELGSIKADVVVTDVELTETTGDHIVWTLRAKTAEVYTTKKQTRLKDIDVDFFDQNGVKSMRLVSDHGVKDDRTGNILASGNVQATAYQEGTILRTSELVYDAQTQLITSDKYVTIQRGNMLTSGEGLESDLSLSGAKILHNVTTSFVLGSEARFKLTEQSLENLRNEGIPDNMLEDLKFLENQEFTHEKNFVNAVEKQIGNEQTVRYKDLILKYAGGE